MIYRVYASFNDPRLPAAFDGAPATAPEHLLMREVAGRMAALSPAAQSILRPFLLPPIYAESWVAQQMGLTAGVALAPADKSKRLAATDVNCRVAANPTGWLRLSTAHFNIHYPDQGAIDTADARIAQAIAAVVEPAYIAMTTLLNRFPLPDTALPCNGGDGALDIYLNYFMPANNLAATSTYNACQADPSYISINSRHPFFRLEVAANPNDPTVQRSVKAVLAHEITHVLQFSMTRAASCKDYEWLDEATAEWAMDHVDPTLDRWEDGYLKLSRTRSRSGSFLLRYLADDHLHALEKPGIDEGPGEHGYAEYLFMQFVARRYGSATIKQIFDAQTSQAPVEALAWALNAQGGMKAVWPEFALTLWNGRAEPVLDYWSRTDRYDYGLADIFNPAPGDTFAAGRTKLKTLAVDQKGQPRASFKLFENALAFPGTYYEIEPRSLMYEHLKFSDNTVHAVMLINPIAVLPERSFMKLQAVKKIGGQWQAPEDWTADSTKSFCLDKRDERLEELILIVSNSQAGSSADPPFRIPELFPVRLSTSNVGCWRWSGTASTTTTYDDGNGSGLIGTINGNGAVRWEISSALPGALQFEPRAGFIDASASGRLGACTFTDVVDRKLAGTGAMPDGRLYINLDLEFGLGEPPNRELTAIDGHAEMRSTRTLVCPNITVSSGLSSFSWLNVDSDSTYRVSADGQRIEGEYIATNPNTRLSINTRFRFVAERE